MGGIILHVDMDSFFASIEANRRGLVGEPIVICMFSGRSEDSGAVATASYEARELGVHAGMPIARAKSCAESFDGRVFFLPADREYYEQVSEELRERVFEQFADRIEQGSVDEAFLDVSERSESFEDAVQLAEHLQEEVREGFDLTCSVGVGPNKLVAKIASDREKPDGLTAVKPSEVEEFMFGLELEDVYGIGPKTVERLDEMGIGSVRELAFTDAGRLVEVFGEKQGLWLREASRGRDDSAVEEEQAKQFSRLVTLGRNSRDFEYVFERLDGLARDVMERVREENVRFRTVTLLVVDTDLRMHSRSESLYAPVQDGDVVRERGRELLEEFLAEFDGEVRRVGIRVSGLEYGSGQKSLDAF